MGKILRNFTHFNASGLILDKANTAASLTSTASHLNKGTMSLYNPDGEAFVNLLSFLSPVVMLSGDELKKIRILTIE